MLSYGALLFTFGLKKGDPCFITSDHFSEKLITYRRKFLKDIFAGINLTSSVFVADGG